jgi:predicted double-glycine peptidase
MSYLFTVFMIATVPLLLGYGLGHRALPERRIRLLPAMTAAILVVSAWIGLSWWTRGYSDTDRWGWFLAEWWAHSGKWYLFGTLVLFFLGAAFGLEGPEMRKRPYRVVLGAVAVLIAVWTLVWRTIPVYVFLPPENQRNENGFILQRVPYTCGPASLGNLMEQYLGRSDVSERELVKLSRTTYEGTTTSGLIRAAKLSGLRVVSCRVMTPEELEAQDQPAIVMLSTIPEVHHATLFLSFSGDTVKFLDPAIGYWSCSRQRFDHIWYGKTLILAPADA